MTGVQALTLDGARDTVLASVARIRRQLAGILWTRIALQSIGGGFVAWLTMSLLASITPLGGRALVVGALATGIVCGMVLARQRGRVSLLRAALWIEEHHSSGYALVTWVEQSSASANKSAWLEQVVAQHSRGSLSTARTLVPTLARAQLIGPLLFCIGTAMLAWGSRFAPIVGAMKVGTRATSAAPLARRAQPIGAWQLRVVPPAYTGLPSRALGDVRLVRALEGSRLEMVGADAVPDSVRVRAPGDSAATAPVAGLDVLPRGWRASVVTRDGPMEVRVMRDRFAKLLLVEGVGDSIPRALLTLPARDSVLRRAEGSLRLEARLHDDLGLARASFEVVISSGEGERFTMRTLQVAAQSLGGQRDAMLRGSLDLSAMALTPGDVLHVRSVARDAHPAADREPGTSETRSFRIARASEYDSIAVEPAPPPEVDKSLLSQRMLLLLTERLQQRRPQLSATVVREESSKLARDQARLRQAVGDAVFQRLTGDAGGEHAHFAGDGHEHGVEAVGGKLALSGVSAQGVLEEGDDAPVIAINKPLLEAYNAMWDAGRALEQTELRAAIPFMRIALEAIERARAASRLYLRGRPPTVIVDIAKVRLSGKDRGVPAGREARSPLPARSAEREARLLAAATLVLVDAQAARDSLAVLRLESLADAPAFAAALSSLLDAFGRPGTDVTDPFVRARRILGGISRVPNAEWSRGGPP